MTTDSITPDPIAKLRERFDDPSRLFTRSCSEALFNRIYDLDALLATERNRNESQARRIVGLEQQLSKLAQVVGTSGKPCSETVSKAIEIIAEVQPSLPPTDRLSDARIVELGADAFHIDINLDGNLMRFARAIESECRAPAEPTAPPKDDLTEKEFRAVFMKTGIPQKIIAGIDIEPKDWHEFANAARRHARAPVETDTTQPLIDWAVMRWHETVSQRPLANVYRRILDDTWREVIKFAGGDPEALVGSRDEAMTSEQSVLAKRPRETVNDHSPDAGNMDERQQREASNG